MSYLKTILITGCSSGIGLHVATRLKADGYRVFATARKAKDVEKLAALGFSACLLGAKQAATLLEPFAACHGECET